MGSRPWITALMDRLSPDHEDERLTVERPNGTVIEGHYVGCGLQGQRRFLILSTAPEGMGVRDPGYLDFQEWVLLERGLKIDGVPADDWGRP